jgi:hypothetical protein
MNPEPNHEPQINTDEHGWVNVSCRRAGTARLPIRRGSIPIRGLDLAGPAFAKLHSEWSS